MDTYTEHADPDDPERPVLPRLPEAGPDRPSIVDDVETERLWPTVYEELYRLAQRYFRSQPKDHTLQPTALVNEAYLKLSRAEDPQFRDQTHFFRTAALAMRQILIDHARRRNRDQKAKEVRRSDFLDPIFDPELVTIDLIALDEALTLLAEDYPRECAIVELRYFGGLNIDKTAEVLSISSATVKRDWSFARAWLLDALTSED